MATLMEKDVLLELSMGAIAKISKHTVTERSSEDDAILHNYYGALIRNPPEIFDFTQMSRKIKEIYDRY